MKKSINAPLMAYTLYTISSAFTKIDFDQIEHLINDLYIQTDRLNIFFTMRKFEGGSDGI